MKVKTQVKAGGSTVNQSEALARVKTEGLEGPDRLKGRHRQPGVGPGPVGPGR